MQQPTSRSPRYLSRPPETAPSGCGATIPTSQAMMCRCTVGGLIFPRRIARRPLTSRSGYRRRVVLPGGAAFGLSSITMSRSTRLEEAQVIGRTPGTPASTLKKLLLRTQLMSTLSAWVIHPAWTSGSRTSSATPVEIDRESERSRGTGRGVHHLSGSAPIVSGFLTERSCHVSDAFP